MNRLSLLIVLLGCCFLAEAQTTEELSNLFSDRKYDELDKRCQEILKVDSGDGQVAMIYGRSLTEENKTPEAVYWLKYALEHSAIPWVKGWACGYLGTCYFRSGDTLNSIAYLDSCLKLNATKNSTTFALHRKLQLGFDDAFANWTIKETAHIRFHFQDSVPIDNIRTFMDRREAAYVQLNDFFQATLQKKIDFYVWRDRESAMQIIMAQIGFSLPAEAVVHSLYNQTPGHELTHVLLMYGIKPIYRTRLINEGIAVAFDQTNRMCMIEAQQAVKKNGVPVDVKFLWENDKFAKEELLYPVGGAWMTYLKVKLSKEEFATVLKDQRYSAISDVLKGRLDALVEAFNKELNLPQ